MRNFAPFAVNFFLDCLKLSLSNYVLQVFTDRVACPNARSCLISVHCLTRQTWSANYPANFRFPHRAISKKLLDFQKHWKQYSVHVPRRHPGQRRCLRQLYGKLWNWKDRPPRNKGLLSVKPFAPRKNRWIFCFHLL